MAYRMYDTVIIKDVRGEIDCPEEMKAYSGQAAHVMKVITAQLFAPPNGNELKVYYELDIDQSKNLWPDKYLKPYADMKDPESEQIDQILRQISQIESILDAIKRVLWRKKRS